METRQKVTTAVLLTTLADINMLEMMDILYFSKL